MVNKLTQSTHSAVFPIGHLLSLCAIVIYSQTNNSNNLSDLSSAKTPKAAPVHREQVWSPTSSPANETPQLRLPRRHKTFSTRPLLPLNVTRQREARPRKINLVSNAAPLVRRYSSALTAAAFYSVEAMI